MNVRVIALTMVFVFTPLRALRADDFKQITYDASTDELVIVIAYQGTNPDHQFTLNWGSCQTSDDGSNEIAGDLLDQQALDAAQQDFTKTIRFPVADLDCRPVTATIRTAPRFLATVHIPARSSATTR